MSDASASICEKPGAQAQQMASSSTPGAASISIHFIQTKVKIGKAKGKCVSLEKQAKQASFLIAVKGCAPNVVLPEIEFCDPMTIWRSATVEAESPLARVVENYWMEAHDGNAATFTGDMAEFWVFLQRDTSEFEALKISLQKDKAKVATRKSDVYGGLLDIWSHNRTINSLHNHIIANDGRSELDKILELFKAPKHQHQQLMQDKFVTDFIAKHHLHIPDELPTSFKYPTMQMEHSILPLLNRVGVAKDGDGDGGDGDELHSSNGSTTKGCLVRDSDNRAHLKMSKAGQVEREFGLHEMEELIEFHAKFMKDNSYFLSAVN